MQASLVSTPPDRPGISRLRPVFALLCAAALLALLMPLPAQALDVPALKGRVNDYADMISPQAEQELTAMLAQLEQSDSTQIAILTIPSLEGDSLEDFSIRTAEAWKIGQKDNDNGAILLVSKGDRKIRIEVGYGLEGVLTDILAGSIVDNEISPRFKAGDFDGGFLAGTSAMTQAVRGEYVAKPTKKKTRGLGGGVFGLLIVLFFIVSIIPRMIANHASLQGTTKNSGALKWLLLASLLGSGPHNRGGGGGFGGGGFGGFSGGGGGFGGGGASGGW